MDDSIMLFKQPVEPPTPSILPPAVLAAPESYPMEPTPAPSQEFLYLCRRIDEQDKTIHTLKCHVYQMQHRCCVFL